MQIIDPKQLIIVASVALINSDNQILIAQRPKEKHLSGLWEFPGGKVEKNESPENTLIRELKEELNININQKCVAPLTFSEFDYKEFNLLLLLYVCRRWDGDPESMENNPIKWVKSNKLREYKMPPADDSLIYCLQDLLLY
jgi:8-oxo-dGTP diphosphatase